MQDGFKIGISAGVAGTAVGLALQNTQEPMLQSIGQGWILGGIAATALLGGIAVLSAKWNQYKQECKVLRSVEKLEKANEEQPAQKMLVAHFVEAALTAADVFEQAPDLKKSSMTERLQLLGMNIADNMPEKEQQVHAHQLANNAMNVVRMKLDQISYGTFHVKTDPARDALSPSEPSQSRSSPSMG